MSEGRVEGLTRTDPAVTARTGTQLTTRITQPTLTGSAPEVKCHCGKTCKNIKGLKIHQARTKCGEEATPSQHRVAAPREMRRSIDRKHPKVLRISRQRFCPRTTRGTVLMPPDNPNLQKKG